MNQFAPKIAENSRKGCRVTGYDGFTRSKMVEIFSKGVLENPSPSVTRHQSGGIVVNLAADESPPAPRKRDQPPATMPDVATVRAQLRALDEALGSDGAIHAVQHAYRQIERATGQRQWRGVAASQRHAEAVALALLNNDIDPETVTPEATPN